VTICRKSLQAFFTVTIVQKFKLREMAKQVE
jgi:hypothetical protein